MYCTPYFICGKEAFLTETCFHHFFFKDHVYLISYLWSLPKAITHQGPRYYQHYLTLMAINDCVWGEKILWRVKRTWQVHFTDQQFAIQTHQQYIKSTYLLYSMRQTHSWENNQSLQLVKKTTKFLWNPQFLYRTDKWQKTATVQNILALQSMYGYAKTYNYINAPCTDICSTMYHNERLTYIMGLWMLVTTWLQMIL
jgi:hypothetical protein